MSVGCSWCPGHPLAWTTAHGGSLWKSGPLSGSVGTAHAVAWGEGLDDWPGQKTMRLSVLVRRFGYCNRPIYWPTGLPAYLPTCPPTFLPCLTYLHPRHEDAQKTVSLRPPPSCDQHIVRTLMCLGQDGAHLPPLIGPQLAVPPGWTANFSDTVWPGTSVLPSALEPTRPPPNIGPTWPVPSGLRKASDASGSGVHHHPEEDPLNTVYLVFRPS